ncbi:hypothetical protein ABW20_dc0100423 [Dactylellina cionopaga]|nr:hypothetical protein ABW20_dc0100423 [Dactylellina cionopaga]
MLTIQIAIAILGFLPVAVNSQWVEPPPGPADPKTVKTCTFWTIAEDSSKADCHTFATDLNLSWDQFKRWNPSVNDDCSGMIVGNAYCIEVSPGTDITTTTAPATTTTPSGPVAPGPTQDGQDPNCVQWEYVSTGQNCANVLAKYSSLTLNDLVKWNPAIGDDCTGLWANTWICVYVKGWVPPTTTKKPTTTAPQNGITTPTPTQAGMVGNCNKFYLVKPGEACNSIATTANIPLSLLYKWNQALNSDCSGLWANVYICIGTTDFKPTPPTTTSANNGVSTPTPIQNGMVQNCNKFYNVKPGDSCDPISRNNGISLEDFYKWNPTVNKDCSGLWTNYFVCVGVIGSKPTPTQPGNGIATPTPIQTGMIGTCKKFHFVQPGETCAVIQKKYGVSIQLLFRWNQAIGADCQGMWAKTYLCVGV